MSLQKYFQTFHKKIKVETEDLREKRNIVVDKVRSSLKKNNHPVPEMINQGSYIYGVGVVPLGDQEYDIDVGLDFDISTSDYEAKEVRSWVYDAIKDHTHNVEDRGPCIRVRYVAGYHVDLVIYARDNGSNNFGEYGLARKDNTWSPTEPKKLKQHIQDARQPFKDTKDLSGSDQFQRITRYLKRWNDLDIPGESPDKPFGLATVLLVIEHLKSPSFDINGNPDDLGALIRVANSVKNTFGRISINKPTQEFEDVFAKLSNEAMEKLKSRFSQLSDDLNKAKYQSEEEACETLRTQFGDDFPEYIKKEDSSQQNSLNQTQVEVRDMRAAIPSFENPARPWAN